MEDLIVHMPSGKYLTISKEDAYVIVLCMGGGCKPENMDSLAEDIIGAYYFSHCPGVPRAINYLSERHVPSSELEAYMFQDIEKYGLDAVLLELKEAAIDMMNCLNALGSHRSEVVDWGEAFHKQQEANNQ